MPDVTFKRAFYVNNIPNLKALANIGYDLGTVQSTEFVLTNTDGTLTYSDFGGTCPVGNQI